MMLLKLIRILKIIFKFLLFGNLRRTKKSMTLLASSHRINYYMTSVFPDKQTKDEILNNIQ